MVRLARVVAVAALTVASTLFAVTPASAAVIDVQCNPPSSNIITFSPPLSLVNQPTVVTRNTQYRPCTSIVSTITSGSSIKTITMLDDCTMVLGTLTVNFIITWNTGATTTVTATRTAFLSGSTLVVNFVGTVTAGLFLGSQVKQQFVGSGIDLINCLNGQGRVEKLVSKVTLTIFH